MTIGTDARIAARAHFDKGRCSAHSQFNGRYCRDVAGPERWCVHCAGFMLLEALTVLEQQRADLSPFQETTDARNELQRIGIGWNGPKEPICVPRADGDWTPWHIAQERLTVLQQQLDEWQRAMSPCKVHGPDLWEGDGTCVPCEGQRLRDERDALQQQLDVLRAEREVGQ